MCPGKFTADSSTVFLLQFLDETPRQLASGHTAADHSSFGNDGILQGSADLVNFYEYGNAVGLHLDGSGYLKIVKSSSLVIPGDLTIEVWLQTNTDGTGYVVLLKGAYGFPRFTTSGVSGYQRTGSDIGIMAASFGSRQLHYYAMVSDGRQLRTYVDGKLYATKSFSGTRWSGDPTMYVGYSNGWNPGANYYKGVIFGVRISSVARTEQEIADHFNQGRSNWMKIDIYYISAFFVLLPASVCIAVISRLALFTC